MTSLTSVTNFAVDSDDLNTVSAFIGYVSNVPKYDDAGESRVRKNLPVHLTERSSSGVTLKIVRDGVNAPRTSIPKAKKPIENAVPGAVKRDLGNGLILCEVNVEGRVVEITLPSYCFDTPVEYGMPFSLSMANRGGYSTPVVSARSPEPLSESERQLFEDVATLFAN